MREGGDRGKGPNKTGTQPAGRKESSDPPGKQAAKGGEGQGSGKARQPGPKKTAARSTKKSRDK